MLLKYSTTAGLVALAFGLGILVGHSSRLDAQAQGHVFELRTYTAPAGKLDALNARFRNHTRRIFDKYGMKSVGYWIPADEPRSADTLIYILQHDSRETAKKSWDAFRQDAEWKKIAAETQKDGPIVSKVDSVFINATDYSAIK
jgi:NDP-sugar pyrophosphorylase family protein